MSSGERPIGAAKGKQSDRPCANPPPPPRPLVHARAASKEKSGGVSGTQKFVYQNWPDQIFPTLNFVLPPRRPLWSGGGGGPGGCRPPPPPMSHGVRPFQYVPGHRAQGVRLGGHVRPYSPEPSPSQHHKGT